MVLVTAVASPAVKSILVVALSFFRFFKELMVFKSNNFFPKTFTTDAAKRQSLTCVGSLAIVMSMNA